MEILSKIKEIFLEQGITKECAFANVVAYDIIRKLGYKCDLGFGVIYTPNTKFYTSFITYKGHDYLPNMDGDEDYEYVLVGKEKDYVILTGKNIPQDFKEDIEYLRNRAALFLMGINDYKLNLYKKEVDTYNDCYKIFNVRPTNAAESNNNSSIWWSLREFF